MSAQDNLSKMQMLKQTGHHSVVHASWKGDGVVTSALIGPHDIYKSADWLGKPSEDHLGNPTLFNVHHAPPHIHSLMSDNAAPGHAAAHLGVVAMHSLHKWGELPSTDPDTQSLSDHSAPIVNRVNLALGRNHSTAVGENGLTKEEGADYASDVSRAVKSDSLSPTRGKNVTPVSQEEIGLGLSAVKSMFSSPKLNKAQFHQPELPQ